MSKNAAPCRDTCSHVGGMPMLDGRVYVAAWGRTIPHEWVDLDDPDGDFSERMRMVRAVMLAGPLAGIHGAWSRASAAPPLAPPGD